ncbi:YecH family metal-binding protein [Ferrimonas marina]|uniref:Probable metal-binding protein n=1 Tax=Ferrimonas marina TaxID=299255 RepID=A0A1M5S7H6_9GAMM|nr:YecH family metal-binding protein [Ferrimonas marina]SHH33883.1 probable metal-binding protein [Ferrimonas marina]
MSSVHAHEFMALLAESAEPKTLVQLAALSEQHFGEAARFHTCKLQDLAIEDLLAFLNKAGKIVPEGEGYVLNRARVCNH